MILTGLCFVAVTASVKMVGTHVPAAQSAFLRYALGLVFLIPMWPAVRGRAPDRQTDLDALRDAGAVPCGRGDLVVLLPWRASRSRM
jgi:drug/metabolite transporter (DMT)-like permease